MRGHLKERSPGHWAIILDVHEPETGKRKRRWHSFVGTKRAAQIECARLISELQGGTYVDPSKMLSRRSLISGSTTPQRGLVRAPTSAMAKFAERTLFRCWVPSD
jgi:hypothetical protein